MTMEIYTQTSSSVSHTIPAKPRSFRQASIDRLLNHERNFPEMETIQLKTGFEVELHTPVFTTPPPCRKLQMLQGEDKLSSDEVIDINRYLVGGLQYGLNYGIAEEDMFDISADHGEDQDTHFELMNELKEQGYIDQSFCFRPMSNIEYRTPPIEERLGGADDYVEKIANALQRHISKVAEQSSKNVVSHIDPPAIELFTGIPTTALMKWTSNNVSIKRIVDKAGGEIKPYVYFQTTTGVLPTEMPNLFQKASEEISNKYKRTSQPLIKAMIGLLEQSIAEVEALDSKIEGTLRQINNGILQEDNYSDKISYDVEALEGWMILITQYLIGSRFEKYEFSKGFFSKNYVGFLSKTPICDTLKALPITARPQSKDIALWEEFFSELVNNINSKSLFEGDLRPQEEQTSEVFNLSDLDWIKVVIKEENPPTIGPGTALGLDSGQANKDLEGTLSTPDQEAIILEDRWLLYKMRNEDIFNMGKVSSLLLKEWRKATERRRESLDGRVSTSTKKSPIFFRYIYLEFYKTVQRAYSLFDTLPEGLPKIDQYSPENLNDAELDDAYKVLRESRNRILTEQRNRKSEWLDNVIMRGVFWDYKDDNNCKPQLVDNGTKVWVKSEGSYIEAFVKDDYFYYRFENEDMQIQCMSEGKLLCYGQNHEWIVKS